MVNNFFKLVKSRIGCGYVFGSQGETMTLERLSDLKKVYGATHYEFNDSQGFVSAVKWINKQTFDCSGLIVWALQQLRLINTSADYTAAGIYSKLCIPIQRAELKQGDLVFIKNRRGDIDHVGVYAEGDKTIEAIGTRRGVVESDASRFNLYGRLKFFKDEAVPDEELKEALLFLSKNAGIDFDIWYKNSKEVQVVGYMLYKDSKGISKMTLRRLTKWIRLIF